MYYTPELAGPDRLAGEAGVENVKQTHPWYAVRVRPRSEKLVSTILRNKGYEEFLPEYISRRRWSDRIKLIAVPLFPSYLFCRVDLARRLPLLTTPGVIHIVGIGSRPFPVAEDEIAAVRAIVSSGEGQPWPFMKSGQRVRVHHGPLAGLEGILIEQRKRYRLVVSVTLLQRSVAVEVDEDCIRPI